MESAIYPAVPHREGSVLAAMLVMMLIALFLFWLPLFGGLIAGILGGRIAGTVGNAIIAAILPSLLLGIALFAFATLLTGIPIIGFIAGMGGMILALTQVGPLLVGAIIGALL